MKTLFSPQPVAWIPAFTGMTGAYGSYRQISLAHVLNDMQISTGRD